MSLLKRYFLTGLFVALPLVISFMIIAYLVNLLTAPFSALLSQLITTFFKDTDLSFFYLNHQQVLTFLSKICALICLFFLICVLGFFARTFFLSKMVALMNLLFRRIPFLSKVYDAIQRVSGAFLTVKRKVYTQVVLVPYPDPHNSCLGLVVGEALKACEDAAGKTLITVLIPTCPIPLTGFLIMVNPKDLIFIDMKMEDALKYVVSCGILSSNQPITALPNSEFLKHLRGNPR